MYKSKNIKIRVTTQTTQKSKQHRDENVPKRSNVFEGLIYVSHVFEGPSITFDASINKHQFSVVLI